MKAIKRRIPIMAISIKMLRSDDIDRLKKVILYRYKVVNDILYRRINRSEEFEVLAIEPSFFTTKQSNRLHKVFISLVKIKELIEKGFWETCHIKIPGIHESYSTYSNRSKFYYARIKCNGILAGKNHFKKLEDCINFRFDFYNNIYNPKEQTS